MKLPRNFHWLAVAGLLPRLAVSGDAALPERVQARSMIVSQYGVVATEHPIASQVGAMILAQGGTAVDAAVAANAAVTFLSPMMGGIGGDLFAIVYDAKSGAVHGLNASGWSPAGLTLEFLQGKGITKMSQSGVHRATVPGAVEGWDQLLRRFGRKKFSEVLAPSIRLAREGAPLPEYIARYWANGEKLLRRDANATRTYLPGDRVPALGEIFRNPELAWSYEQIARRGRAGFYEGEIARRIIATTGRLGGTMALADLKEYSAEWVTPLATTYHGWTVHQIPPNGQGIAVLSMLNLMERFPIAKFGHNSADALHVEIEAKKLAYADMLRYVTDPRFSEVPVKGILSKDYAARQAQRIDSAKAQANVPPGPVLEIGNDTTYLCAVDRDGNMISLIQSNYSAFGCGIVPDGTGFVLQDRGSSFSTDPTHPNVAAGRKRPLHTIIPGFMQKDGIRVAFGIMGGPNQPQAHAQFVSNIVDHGMNIQAALEAPRFTKRNVEGYDVQMENRIPAETRAELEKRGHEIKVIDAFGGAVGGGQAVMRNFNTGVNYGASDPRKDGAAVPEPFLK